MKKLIYTLLLLLVTFPAMAQSLFEQYERFLTEPRTYVCRYKRRRIPDSQI